LIDPDHIASLFRSSKQKLKNKALAINESIFFIFEGSNK